jgi:hypothetical protein
MNPLADNTPFLEAIKTFWPAAKEVLNQGREIKDDLPTLKLLIDVFDIGKKIGLSDVETSEIIYREEPGRVPEDFSAAMHEHIRLCEELGDEHPEAKRALTRALHIAPRWFIDGFWEKYPDDLPEHSYTEDGQAVITSTALAEHFGISHEEVCEKIEEMEETLGITVPRSSGTLHRKQ